MPSMPVKRPKSESNLSDAQFGLFEESHPAMRRRTPAEFTPEEFREKPGAWFHGTFAPDMPRESHTNLSAGIHLGTLESAKDRLDTMGPRDSNKFSGYTGEKHPEIPADIHVRRLHPTVQTAPDTVHPRDADIDRTRPHMQGSPGFPNEDLGHRWDVKETYYDPNGEERGAHNFGEFYRNETEDPGSVSIRVPHAGYLQSHREAVSSAIRMGKPVNATTRGLIEHHGGAGVDQPEPYKPLSRQDEKESRDPYHDERVTEHGALASDPGQPALLPYKVRINPSYAMDNPDTTPKDRDGPPGQRILSNTPVHRTRNAVTFTATTAEAREMSSSLSPGQFGRAPKWMKNYYVK